MPSSTTELIKEKLDVVEFLKGYLTLQPAGRNFKARCPFHQEKTPSFMVSPERQSWHCFGCGLGGDVFTFLMRYENFEFTEALKVLAEKVGVELRQVSPAEYQFAGVLYDANTVAKEFFKGQLKESKVALEYLAGRGLQSETIEEFELGWAPNESEALTLHFSKAGYRPEDVIRAGLVFKTDRGLQFDRFRGRIMFPIHNHVGKVVGFTGRILPKFDDGQMGKYINSPETPVFTKSKLLYGFWKSRNHIRDAGAAFLVEGQMDFLMSWQNGVQHAVASSGTALTTDHLRAIRRLTDHLLLSFDSDEAGMAAGERAIDLAEAHDFNVKVVSLGAFKDPADAVLADPENIKRALLEAVPAPQFYFKRYLAFPEFNYSDRAHLRSLRTVLTKLKQLTSPVEQSMWMKELSRHVHIEESLLREEAEKLENPKREEAAHDEAVFQGSEKFSRRDLVSQKLLAAVCENRVFHLLVDSRDYLPIAYVAVLDMLDAGKTKSDDPALDHLLELVTMQTSEALLEDIPLLKQELLKEYVKEKRQDLTMQVKRAEAAGDEKKLHSLLEELQKLSWA